eukprot:364898-Chlamydomonas_euryale.AAC.4
MLQQEFTPCALGRSHTLRGPRNASSPPTPRSIGSARVYLHPIENLKASDIPRRPPGFPEIPKPWMSLLTRQCSFETLKARISVVACHFSLKSQSLGCSSSPGSAP